MKADIIILSRGERGLIYRCLDSIKEHVPEENLGTVYIGWNGPSEDKEKVVKLCKDRGLDYTLKEMPYHYSKNTNELARLCKNEALLLLNDDVALLDDFVPKGLRFLENPNVGTVGCKLVRPDKSIQHAGVLVAVDAAGRFVGAAHIAYNQPDRPMGDLAPVANTAACMLVGREYFLSMGGMNEDYKERFQDLEQGLAAVVDGKTNICLASCTELHDESQSSSSKPLEEDFSRVAKFFDYHIADFMASINPSVQWMRRMK